MKAAIVHSFDQPLVLEDVPIPVAGPEQVLVRIEACGLCHTDIHAARGEWPVKPEPPFIPGHEGVGIIERVGSGNSHGLQEGMRVALPRLGYACGDCRYCNSGSETLCESQINTGYGMNGGFAEYAIGYARHVVRVPDDVNEAIGEVLDGSAPAPRMVFRMPDVPTGATDSTRVAAAA
jgi:propanol-preferring alcohol dehydrogenase